MALPCLGAHSGMCDWGHLVCASVPMHELHMGAGQGGLPHPTGDQRHRGGVFLSQRGTGGGRGSEGSPRKEGGSAVGIGKCSTT